MHIYCPLDDVAIACQFPLPTDALLDTLIALGAAQEDPYVSLYKKFEL